MNPIAMFPLGTPLLPGGLLPLQIFEPRYVQMLRSILADDSKPPEFGVTMIEKGHEVGGGDIRSTVGVIARIRDINAHPGDRYTLVAAGTDRFKVETWLPDDPYPLAEVQKWPDEAGDEVSESTVAELHKRLQSLNDLVREIGELSPPDDKKISSDPYIALFHIASIGPFGPADRYRILAAPSLAKRAEILSSVIDDAFAVWEFRRS